MHIILIAASSSASPQPYNNNSDLYNTAVYNTALHNTALYNTVLYSTALYSTALLPNPCSSVKH